MSKLILNSEQLNLTLKRLMLEIIERFNDFSNVAIIGLQPRGVLLSRIFYEMLKKELGSSALPYYGELDITFYRDDFRRREETLTPSKLDINFDIENKQVLLLDDVLYTGRSIRAALDALSDFGRPLNVELLTLIDRRHNRELPIEADYVGLAVDTRKSGLRVKVDLIKKNEVVLVDNN
jgi:pyrimidine operon attenuation protein/uracil phosphoribosyltransferase